MEQRRQKPEIARAEALLVIDLSKKFHVNDTCSI
jgi:hypothetical protein